MRPSSCVMASVITPSSQSDSRITQFSQLHRCIITVYSVFVQSRCLPKHLRVNYKHCIKTASPALPLRPCMSAMKCYSTFQEETGMLQRASMDNMQDIVTIRHLVTVPR